MPDHSANVAGVLLAAGETGDLACQPFLAAIDSGTGKELWRESLPGPVVKGGTAIDHRGCGGRRLAVTAMEAADRCGRGERTAQL